MRIIFTGGGTVGHVSPAIAIAEEFAERYPNSEMLFVGREGGAENEIVKGTGMKVEALRIRGLERKITARNFLAVRDAVRSRSAAKKIIQEFNADIVVGTGGYVCWPVISAARSMGIFTVMHESNAVLGLTSRLLFKKVDLCLLGQNIAQKGAEFVGNPIRKSFGSIDRRSARSTLGLGQQDLLIVSVGGSIGAQKLNDACIELMRTYSQKNKRVHHIHSCGRRYYGEIEKELGAMKDGRCKAVPYISDMPAYLHAADLVISRCGAMTLSEIGFCGTPSVLIPSPNVTNDHQRKNAEQFLRSGASLVIEEKDLDSEALRTSVDKILSDRNKRIRMSKCAKNCIEEHAASKCVDAIMERFTK